MTHKPLDKLVSISAVLIVKNEEVLLDDCLKSLEGVDEIIVCDTGSNDGTASIAERHNAVVVNFDWCDDFSAARNFAKSHATGEWIFSIDADEVLDEGGVQGLREAAESAGDAVSMAVQLIAQGSGHQHWVPRFFRKEVDWVGQVHELPAVTAQRAIDVSITYGYSPAHEQDPDRVLRILSSIEDPTSRDLYYLAREYFYRSLWDQAVEAYKEYLKVATWMPERADAWLMLARCLWQSGRADEARDACASAILNNANFKEALLFMAEMSWPENAKRWRSFAELATNEKVLFVRT